jgi:hypothetical protein
MAMKMRTGIIDHSDYGTSDYFATNFINEKIQNINEKNSSRS